MKIPVKILVKKIPRKQNSIFYCKYPAIAQFRIGNRTYVLTTAGEYRFYDKVDGKTIYTELSTRVINKLTDRTITQMGRDDLQLNWGWFGINVWQQSGNPTPGLNEKGGIETCLNDPTDAYSTYDEAMTAFKEYIEKDLTEYLRDDWIYEVQNKDTCLGYKEWLWGKIISEEQ